VFEIDKKFCTTAFCGLQKDVYKLEIAVHKSVVIAVKPAAMSVFAENRNVLGLFHR
jgi:hypothetical protein